MKFILQNIAMLTSKGNVKMVKNGGLLCCGNLPANTLYAFAGMIATTPGFHNPKKLTITARK